jgi:hypothetical protein
MAMKALLQGDAGNYRIRGAIWELGTQSYRAYVHLVPARPRGNAPRAVVSADGMTMQEVLGATKARVSFTVGTPVEHLEVLPSTTPSPGPDDEPARTPEDERAGRRFPSPTD